jgi:hypothetical protein
MKFWNKILYLSIFVTATEMTWFFYSIKTVENGYSDFLYRFVVVILSVTDRF